MADNFTYEKYQEYFPKGWAHAVAGTLKGKPGMIEYYELHPFPNNQQQRKSNNNNPNQQEQEQEEQPILVAVVKVGNQLDGPVGCVHGGIIALLFDDVMGFASTKVLPCCVTRDLSVEYKVPQPHDEYVVIRVYCDEAKTAEYHTSQKQKQLLNKEPLKKRVFLRATCSSLGSNSDIHTVPFQNHNDDDDAVLYSRATITMVQTQRPASARDSQHSQSTNLQSRL